MNSMEIALMSLFVAGFAVFGLTLAAVTWWSGRIRR
jgi:hypothetical protein